MKPWYSFRNSILKSLPHSPHHLPSIQLKHVKLDSHNVNHGVKSQEKEKEQKQHVENSDNTNTICIYNKRGIYVLHKETVNTLTEIILPEPRHCMNDGSLGIYMASPLLTNTIYHVEGLAGEREEPIPIPECYARVTEGIPPVNAQWNTNICMKHEDVKTTYIATPILIHNYFYNGGVGGGGGSTTKATTTTTTTTTVVYFTSGGTVTMIDTATGNVIYQVQTKATWNGDAGGKTLHHLNSIDIDEIKNSGMKYVYPHCFIISDKNNGMIGCVGDSYLVVLNEIGEIMNHIFLIDPPLNEVSVVKLPSRSSSNVGGDDGKKNNNINNKYYDYMIVTSTHEGIVGYRLEHVLKSHESSGILIGVYCICNDDWICYVLCIYDGR